MLLSVGLLANNSIEIDLIILIIQKRNLTKKDINKPKCLLLITVQIKYFINTKKSNSDIFFCISKRFLFIL